MNPRQFLRWPFVSLTANVALFVIVITADFYGWIPGWVTVIGLVVGVVWLFLNHMLPRAWYGWLKPVARSQGWDHLLESELIHDAFSARMAGRWDQAAPSLEQGALVAGRRGDVKRALNYLTDAATGYVFMADFANARRCRDAAADLAGTLADEAAKRHVRWVNGLIAWYSGDRAEAHRLLEDFSAHEAGADPLRAGVATLALAQMDSDEGNHASGLARLNSQHSAELASPRMSLLGLLLLRTGRFKGARLALEHGRSTRPLLHRTANALAEDSLTLALLDLAEGNAEPAQQALLATSERHSHDVRMLQADLLTALGGVEERSGSPDRARELFNAALKGYEGIAPAKMASLRHHLGESTLAVPTNDPLALYYGWPPPAAEEPIDSLPSSPLVDRRSKRRVSPNTIASVGTAAVTLLFFLPLGWPAAVGLLALLAIHEFGHYFGARLLGVQARTPIFLGLLGAATIIDRKQADLRRDAAITLAGPATGLAVAGICLAASFVAPPSMHTVLVALARGGFILNLLNLLPILPMDGGRVASALHRNWLIAGLVLEVAVLVFLFRAPGQNVTAIAFIVATLGGTVWMFTRARDSGTAGGGRGLVAAAYVGMFVFAAAGLVGGFYIGLRSPTHVVGNTVVADGFTASIPSGWTVASACCNEVLELIRDDPAGARTRLEILDLRDFGIGSLTNRSATDTASAELAADLKQPGGTTIQSVIPLDVPGLDGVEFLYTCSCHSGYRGEEWTSEVVVLAHGDRMLSIVLGTYTREYANDHASLFELLSGWSWTT